MGRFCPPNTEHTKSLQIQTTVDIILKYIILRLRIIYLFKWNFEGCMNRNPPVPSAVSRIGNGSQPKFLLFQAIHYRCYNLQQDKKWWRFLDVFGIVL